MVGLAVVGVLLLGAIGVVAAMTVIRHRGGDDDTLDLTDGSGESNGQAGTTVAADSPTADAPTADSASDAASAPPTSDEATGGKSGVKPDAPTATGGKPPVSTTSTSTPTATSKPPAGPTGAAACQACLASAQSGNVSGAVANYGKCDNPSKKQQCARQLGGPAQGAANAAALNGNCAGARQIVNSAKSIGARVRLPAQCK